MNPGNNLNLEWNDFSTSTSRAFHDLLLDTSFADVTLVTDDSQQLTAHKVVLSACSDFFKSILQRNPHQHPLIYLKDSKFNHLQAILRFVYSGRTEIAQDDLDQFFRTAEDLKINGLVKLEDIDQKKTSRKKGKPHVNDSPSTVVQTNKEVVGSLKVAEKDEKIIEASRVNPKLEPLVEDNEVDNMVMELYEDGKSAKVKVIQCENCDKTFSTRGSMLRHKGYAHEGVRFACNQCDHNASTAGNLKAHQRVHTK